MTEKDKAKGTTTIEEMKVKTKELWTKYMVLCGKVYDFFATIWRGQRKHTPETLAVSQKRGTWIVSLFIALAIIGAFMDEEELSTDDSNASSETSAEVDDIMDSTSKTREGKAVPVKSEESNKIKKDSHVRVSASTEHKPIVSVYVCSDCGTVVTGASQPRSMKCPRGNFHHWDNIGMQGNTAYQCGKCGATINSQPTPRPGRCPRGLGHHWDRL